MTFAEALEAHAVLKRTGTSVNTINNGNNITSNNNADRNGVRRLDDTPTATMWSNAASWGGLSCVPGVDDGCAEVVYIPGQ